MARRFGGVERLYGAAASTRFASARVCVVGIGGVGSWAAEALARSAVGGLCLIDLDMVAESNTNRQIHALGDAYGRAKVEAMGERVRAINPLCRVELVEDFVTAENAASLLKDFDVVLDAIDNVSVKVAIAALCKAAGWPLVMCGGAGGKSDPAQLRVSDLANTEQDPLLSKVRARLRKEHAFPRDLKKRFGIEVVYSGEPLQRPVMCEGDAAPQGLSCAGYGSGVVLTASMGMFAAAQVLRHLLVDVPAPQRAVCELS